MKKLVIVLLFTQIAAAQGGMFGKDPIINKENWNKQRVHWGYFWDSIAWILNLII